MDTRVYAGSNDVLCVQDLEEVEVRQEPQVWPDGAFKEKLRIICPKFELNSTIVAKRTHF